MRTPLALSIALSAAACARAGPPSPPTTTLTLAPAASSGPRLAERPCDDDRYQPAPATSATPPKLPPLPAFADVPRRNGEAFTVRGALHALRTPGELTALAPDDIVIEGVIVDENVGRAPRCALHPSGKADPKGCTPEIPSFWIAEDERPGSERIRVLGWASRFAEVYEAQRLGRATSAGGKPKLWRDDRWGTEVPWPLPTTGKRVRVRGTYAQNFEKISGAIVNEPRNGILSFKQLDYL